MHIRLAMIALAGALGLSGTAHAIVIDSSNFTGCDGQQTCTITQGGTSVTITAESGASPNTALIDIQNFAGIQGLGIQYIVTGQARDPEIQGDPGPNGTLEALTFAFAPSQIITEIRLAHFYNPSQFSSDPQEVALFSGDLAASIQVLDNLGNYILGGSLSGASASLLSADQGLWSINTAGSTFGSTYISTLTFRAKNTPLGLDNSDFSVASVTAVPEPATLMLLGTGLVGLGALLRRRQASMCPA